MREKRQKSTIYDLRFGNLRFTVLPSRRRSLVDRQIVERQIVQDGGGPFRDSPVQSNGVPPWIPVDLYVAGIEQR